MLLTSIVWPDPLVVPHLKGAEQCGYVDVGELAARDEEDDCHAVRCCNDRSGVSRDYWLLGSGRCYLSIFFLRYIMNGNLMVL